MSVLQEKLDLLLDKYAVPAKATLSENGDAVTVDGSTFALLPWRHERRFIELKKVCENSVGQISHVKFMSINPKDVPLDALIRRELDTAEYVCSLKVTGIFKVQNGPACSVICMTDKQAVITLELAATLPVGAAVIDKHEIITDRGTACDRNVDSQTPLSSVYVFGEKNEEYTDVDFELYGLSIREISIVRQAFDVAKDPALGKANNAMADRLALLVRQAAESEKRCENVIL